MKTPKELSSLLLDDLLTARVRMVSAMWWQSELDKSKVDILTGIRDAIWECIVVEHARRADAGHEEED